MSHFVLFFSFLSLSSEISSKKKFKPQEENLFQTVRFNKWWPEIDIHLLKIHAWFLPLTSAPDQKTTLVSTDVNN